MTSPRQRQTSALDLFFKALLQPVRFRPARTRY
jgi:hypothetical protein